MMETCYVLTLWCDNAEERGKVVHRKCFGLTAQKRMTVRVESVNRPDTFTGTSPMDCQKQAKRCGWSLKAGRHLCPTCAATDDLIGASDG